MANFFDFIINYWSQLTVVLGAIMAPTIYFFKRYFDLKDKKAELKRSLFQTEKVRSITDFLRAYGELETFYNTAVSPNIDTGQINKNNFDIIFRGIMSKFQGTYNVLFVYLNATELEPFIALYKSQISVHTNVTEFFALYTKGQSFELSTWLNKKNLNVKNARDNAERAFRQIGVNYVEEYK